MNIKNKYLRRVLIAVALILAAGMAVFIVAEALVIRGSRGSAEPDADYLIVLGAKVNSQGGQAVPSSALYDRLAAALDYLTANPDTVAIVTGGQGPDEPISEAECMADWLTEQGLDPGRIVLEDRATSTRENLYFSVDLIGDGWEEKKIAVVSSEYHLCRANYLGRKLLGYDFSMVPAPTSLVSYKLYYFFREALGMVYTRLFYIR